MQISSFIIVEMNLYTEPYQLGLEHEAMLGVLWGLQTTMVMWNFKVFYGVGRFQFPDWWWVFSIPWRFPSQNYTYRFFSSHRVFGFPALGVFSPMIGVFNSYNIFGSCLSWWWGGGVVVWWCWCLWWWWWGWLRWCARVDDDGRGSDGAVGVDVHLVGDNDDDDDVDKGDDGDDGDNNDYGDGGGDSCGGGDWRWKYVWYGWWWW